MRENPKKTEAPLWIESLKNARGTPRNVHVFRANPDENWQWRIVKPATDRLPGVGYDAYRSTSNPAPHYGYYATRAAAFRGAERCLKTLAQ